jgi:hypothetical protein
VYVYGHGWWGLCLDSFRLTSQKIGDPEAGAGPGKIRICPCHPGPNWFITESSQPAISADPASMIFLGNRNLFENPRQQRDAPVAGYTCKYNYQYEDEN